jgi:NAD(P)-dependent dehydrogenase (short-subunit alcohol dehydrogenase family)
MMQATQGRTIMNESSIARSSRLEGQVALVTGGGRGIGRAIAQALAAAGAAVAVLARSQEQLAETVRLIERDGGRCRSFPADITDAQAVRDAIKAIEQSFGPVDVLVNNAGEVKPFAPLWQTDVDEWWRGMEVNLRGPLLYTRFALPSMVARGKGRIINISSGAGAMGMPFYSSYVCSQAALIRFTEYMALETKSHGIAVFSISPGTVRTAMSEYSLYSPEGQKGLPWFRRLFDENVVVPAERPANLVLELASGRADALSGRFLSIYDELEHLLKNSAQIEKQNLHTLKVEKLPSAQPNPVLASILAEARTAAK